MELKSSEGLVLPLRNVNKITRKQKIGMKKTRQDAFRKSNSKILVPEKAEKMGVGGYL